MKALAWTARFVSAYVIAQLTVGLQLGVAIAWAVLAVKLPLPVALGALLPLGLLLLAVQYPLAVRMVAEARPVS